MTQLSDTPLGRPVWDYASRRWLVWLSASEHKPATIDEIRDLPSPRSRGSYRSAQPSGFAGHNNARTRS